MSKTLDKRGPQLEYLVAGVFQAQGYLVRTSVSLKAAGGDDATDVDVLGVRFSNPFQLHRIACDCKQRQRPKPYERILWSRGLAHFLGLSEVYVALPRTSLDVRRFAHRGQVRVITEDVLNESYARAFKQGGPYGLISSQFRSLYQEKLVAHFKKDKSLGEVLAAARHLLLSEDPYVGMNLALGHIVRVSKHVRDVHRDPESRVTGWTFAVAELVVVFSVLLMAIAADVVGMERQQREAHISQRLTFGDMAPQKAMEIFRLAQLLALESARGIMGEKAGQALLPFDSAAVIEPPAYAPGVVGLVERALLSPEIYQSVPQILDFLLFSQALPKGEFLEEEYKSTFSEHRDERLKAARNILSFVRDQGGVDLAAFWPRHESNLPRITGLNIAANVGSLT